MDMQIKAFNRFPPMLAHIDSTREDFLANGLMRKYGESRIIPIKFGNTGTTNTKYHLKQVGFSFIDAKYEWPDDTVLEKTSPRIAKLVRILKMEMMHEQVEYTDTGRVTFKHPTGNYHNDLVHGWELSLDAVMQFQQKNLGYELVRPNNQSYFSELEEYYSNIEEYVEDEIYDRPLGSGVPY